MKAFPFNRNKIFSAFLLGIILLIIMVSLNSPFGGGINKDYHNWIDDNERFVGKYLLRGDVSTEINYALSSIYFEKLLSRGAESHAFIENKYIEYYESERWGETSHWDRMLAIKMAELRSLDCGDWLIELPESPGLYGSNEDFFNCVYRHCLQQ